MIHADLVTEQALLGSLVVDSGLIPLVAEKLKPEHFASELHRLTFSAIRDLYADHGLADTAMIAGWLRQRGRGDAIAFLADIEIAGNPMAVLRHVDVLDELYIRRKLAAEVSRTAEAVKRTDGDARDILADTQAALYALNLETAQKGYVPAASIVEKIRPELERTDAAAITGIATGFKEFDWLTLGLNAGQYLVLGGRPGMGKSAFAVNAATHMAREHTVGYVSLEMTEDELIMRAVSSLANVPFKSLRRRQMTADQRATALDAAERVRGLRLFVDDQAEETPQQLAARARRLHAQYGLDVLIIDHLHLMTPDGRGENRNLELSAISRACKILAKDLGIVVVALAQLSRKCEERPNKRPMPSDLRESGSIEQDADLIAFLYRDCVYNPPEIDANGVALGADNRGDAELILAKHRNGETGIIELAFFGDTMTFRTKDAYYGGMPV